MNYDQALVYFLGQGMGLNDARFYAGIESGAFPGDVITKETPNAAYWLSDEDKEGRPVAKYNTAHDAHGRFAHGPGSATGRVEAHAAESHREEEAGAPTDGKHAPLPPTAPPKGLTHANIADDPLAMGHIQAGHGSYGDVDHYKISQEQEAIARRIVADPERLKTMGINPNRPDFSEQKALVAVQEKVKNRAQHWNGTSADHSAEALSMQKAISEEFGLQKAWTVVHDRVKAEGGSAVLAKMDELHTKYGAENRTIARSFWEQTQERLKADGIDSVTLYRGVQFKSPSKYDSPESALPKWTKYGYRDNIAMQPANSFSASSTLAGQFAGVYHEEYKSKYTQGHILAIQVPRERILGTGRNGFGTMYESEFVVLGGQTPGRNLQVGEGSHITNALEASEERLVLKPPKKESGKWFDSLILLVEAQKYNKAHGEHGHFAHSSLSGPQEKVASDHTKSTAPPKEVTHATAKDDARAVAYVTDHGKYGMGGMSVKDSGPVYEQRTKAVAARIMADPEKMKAMDLAKGHPTWGEHEIQQELEYRIGDVTTHWSGTSGDNNPRALALQHAAAEEFGLGKQWSDIEGRVRTAKNTGDSFDTPESGAKALAKESEIHAAQGAGNRVILRTMYEETQDRLSAAGIDNVTVYRGVHFDKPPGDPSLPKWTNYGYRDNIPLQPLNSFSSSLHTAAMFAGAEQSGKINGSAHVIAVQVPRERIFSTGHSGLGTLGEQEYVILGGKTPGKNLSLGEGSKIGYTVDEVHLVPPGASAAKPKIAAAPPKPIETPKVAAAPKAPTAITKPVASPASPKAPEMPKVAATPKAALPHLSPATGTDAKASKLLDRGQDVGQDSVRSSAKKQSVSATANEILKDPAMVAAVSKMYPKVSGLQGKAKVEDSVNRVIGSWESTSADNAAHALAFQRAVAEEFGTGGWEGMRKAKSAQMYGKEALAKADEVYATHGEGMRAIARSMYTATQKHLAASGVKEMTLHRGMRYGEYEKPSWHGQSQPEIEWQPISSWTSKTAVANGFAKDNGYGNNKVVVSAKVPRERIFSFPRTGAGSLPEYEYIVLAGLGPVSAKQVK